MESEAKLLGHPIRPMLIVFPFGLLPPQWRSISLPYQLPEAGRTFVQEARSALLHADRAIHLARAAHHGYENVLLVGHAHHADQEWVRSRVNFIWRLLQLQSLTPS
jgi:hypothetical protein